MVMVPKYSLLCLYRLNFLQCNVTNLLAAFYSLPVWRCLFDWYSRLGDNSFHLYNPVISLSHAILTLSQFKEREKLIDQRKREMGSFIPAEKPLPHAFCVPFPAQGHVNPMLKLAKLLNYKGFHITFVNTEYNHNRLLKSRGPDSLNGTPTFRFETIPDGLPPSDANVPQDMPSLCESTKKTCLAPFRQLLSKLNNTSSSNVPPVTCIVSDCVMSFTLKAAQELNIPNVLFWTASACGFLAYVHYQGLIERGLVPLKGIKLKDLPSLIRTTDPDDVLMNFAIGEVENAHNASALIFNTVDDLEREVLEAVYPTYPPIYTIGPIQLLLNHEIPPDDNSMSAIESNLWKEKPGCLEWLNTMESNSVVYVNFGSITVMTEQQLVEFAWGLANSKQDFLWVIRPDLVIGESAILPPEFVLETRERSLLASMEIESNSNRDEIERWVRELMEGDKGKQMKKKAMEWKSLVEKASTAPNGSSHLNLEKMIAEVLGLSPSKASVRKWKTVARKGPMGISSPIQRILEARQTLKKKNRVGGASSGKGCEEAISDM
ncbi:hypothetical protein EZV62_021948 [Acer yangbiense]|uniref:Glycosyltransferase N-terminal domain-containing protein n=1 Tax=Acer yangbiense TaxID=1000413 RepID=A0A5C7H7Q3_9ROSI|nr:hypothetical protein EZV62_021948 [Acer yangbiense]